MPMAGLNFFVKPTSPPFVIFKMLCLTPGLSNARFGLVGCAGRHSRAPVLGNNTTDHFDSGRNEMDTGVTNNIYYGYVPF